MATKSKKSEIVTAADSGDRKKALESAISRITKAYGSGSIMRLGENEKMNIESIPTGSLMLDFALGIGGIPRGRIVEIYGPESSGKTTVALHIASEAQKMGGTAAYIDVECALDRKYAKALGVNIDELLVSQPDSGEQALEICDALVRSGAVDVIVVDSVAALTTQAEIDGDMGAATVGAQARLMSSALRKLSASISKSNCAVIFINQLREKIGVMYGNPETTPGGKALKFYASVRIDVRKGEPLKKGTETYGNRVKCKIVKNKVAPPFKVATFDMIYGHGISKSGEIFDLAVELGLIEKAGSWFSYNGNRIAQGKDNTKDYFEKNPELMKELEEKLKAMSEKLENMSGEENMLGAEEDDEDEGFDIGTMGLGDDD